MTIVRVGSTSKYSDGWDKAFGKSRSRSTSAQKSNSPKKKSAKKAVKRSNRKRS